MAKRPFPSERIADRIAIEPERAGFVVDLRRCIGCHACSVACKTAHEIPLGEFPMRVRWLPRPVAEKSASTPGGNRSGTYGFLPVFSESLCHDDSESTQVGLDPACVRACPTDALLFGDLADPASTVYLAEETHPTRLLEAPEAADLKENVRYIGLESWMGPKINLGAALDPRDEDPIYEQPPAEKSL